MKIRTSVMQRIFLTSAVTMVVLAVGSLTSWALSPPQYTLWRQVHASIGASPFVQIGQMREIDDGHYEFDVQTRCRDMSSALAAVLTSEYDFGGIQVKIYILNPDGSPAVPPFQSGNFPTVEEIAACFVKALIGNPYVNRVMPGRGTIFDCALWVECKRKIIQFWNDNIGDYYGNDVYVAADVFRAVMRTSFETASGGVSIGFTTRPAGVLR